jgi:hypothetical protein
MNKENGGQRDEKFWLWLDNVIANVCSLRFWDPYRRKIRLKPSLSQTYDQRKEQWRRGKLVNPSSKTTRRTRAGIHNRNIFKGGLSNKCFDWTLDIIKIIREICKRWKMTKN